MISRLLSILIASVLLCHEAAVAEDLAVFQRDVRPLLEAYCVSCHQAPEAKGRTDLDGINSTEAIEASFEAMRAAVRMLTSGQMPPKDEPQPTREEIERLVDWYEVRYVKITPRAARLRPRRLSAHEYRNTLRSLIGFDLEVTITEAEETVSEKSMVMKLLPTDPPGASGFRNDTHRNPISTIAWNRYSELADLALEQLFSPAHRTELEKLTGPLQSDGSIGHDQAELLLRQWLPKVFRRPVQQPSLDHAIERLKQAGNTQDALRTEMKTSLMSPAFLYRGLLASEGPAGQRAVDNFELAERLSYFLWADMPDEELSRVAIDGSLQDEAILRQQVQRMLASPKADNLTNDVARQWLSLDEINEVSDDVPIVAAYRSQALDFIAYLIREDRPIIELIDSKVEFINDFTAKFYGDDRKQLKRHRKPTGIEVQIIPNQRIELVSTTDRGGVLTMPGILAMNRGAIIRGTWILERILGEPLPDPPANVGQVKPNQPGQELSFRQRFEQHRAQASCALCHDKIDPLGFVLESYDPSGTRITTQPPDTSGQLPSGEKFNNISELKEILRTSQRRAVLRNVVCQFLAYALCRRIEYYDQPVIEQIVDRLDQAEQHGTYQQLIQEIVLSLPFRQATFAGAQP